MVEVGAGDHPGEEAAPKQGETGAGPGDARNAEWDEQQRTPSILASFQICIVCSPGSSSSQRHKCCGMRRATCSKNPVRNLPLRPFLSVGLGGVLG